MKLALSAVAVGLSLWLLTGVLEAEPGIAYDAALTKEGAAGILQNGAPPASETDQREVSEIVRQMVEDFDKQRAVNEDTAGWLLIPNVCYYPIMYSPVYDYYLKRDHNRSASAQGAIFINGQCAPDFDNMLMLIHGHNMKNATMFGQLHEYLGEDFFQRNSPVIIYDGALLRTYKPFTAVVLEENNDVIDARDLSDVDRTSYIESMYNRSVCKMERGEVPDLAKPVVFFSTCDYSFSEARLLVGAYLVETVEVR